MFHHRIWSHRRTYLFLDPVEALALWHILADMFPDMLGMCLMLDHAHVLLSHADPEDRLADAESAYARWRNHRRGQSGPVFAPHPPVEEIPEKRQRRVLRYVLLNPCRGGLADDPLRYALSTHRDRCRLTATPLGPVEGDPADFHRYVSSDPTVVVGGTPFPSAPLTARWSDVVAAVAAATRCLPEDLRRRGPARTLAIRTAWYLGIRDVPRLLAATALSPRQLRDIVATVPPRGATLDHGLLACVTIAGDDRFRLQSPK